MFSTFRIRIFTSESQKIKIDAPKIPVPFDSTQHLSYFLIMRAPGHNRGDLPSLWDVTVPVAPCLNILYRPGFGLPCLPIFVGISPLSGYVENSPPIRFIKGENHQIYFPLTVNFSPLKTKIYVCKSSPTNIYLFLSISKEMTFVCSSPVSLYFIPLI